MLEAAGLEAVGVYFLDAEADREARAAFTRAEGGQLLAHDPRMADLRKRTMHIYQITSRN